jgi:hypothetical protein
MANIKIPRGEKGRAYAETVLEQTETLANGEPDDSFVTNHVLRALRKQARAGVGSQPGELPAAAFAHLCDRAFGKESEKLAVRQPGKPFEALTTEQLAARMDKLSKSIRGIEVSDTEH